MLVAQRPKSVSAASYAQSLLVEPRKTSLHLALASVASVQGHRGRWFDAFKPAAFFRFSTTLGELMTGDLQSS